MGKGDMLFGVVFFTEKGRLRIIMVFFTHLLKAF